MADVSNADKAVLFLGFFCAGSDLAANQHDVMIAAKGVALAGLLYRRHPDLMGEILSGAMLEELGPEEDGGLNVIAKTLNAIMHDGLSAEAEVAN